MAFWWQQPQQQGAPGATDLFAVLGNILGQMAGGASWADAWRNRANVPVSPGQSIEQIPGGIGAAAGTIAGGGSAGGAAKAYAAPPVAPGEAIKQTAQGLVGQGPLANLRQYGIWALIALVGVIGLWGLLSPGGGVAILNPRRR